jgi:pterin-4a-carbinolamine dehydratase
MNAVADEAKAAKHHPEWCNVSRAWQLRFIDSSWQVYNRVTIRWTTHRDRETKLRGLTGEDLRLAACCDELARKHGAKELSAFKSDDQESFEKLANSP